MLLNYRVNASSLLVRPLFSSWPIKVVQAKENQGRKTMSFGIYIAGYFILIIGLAIGANMLNLPAKWIGVAVVCLVGIAIVHGVTATRQKDAAS